MFGFTEDENVTLKKFLLPIVATILAAPAWADISLNPYIYNSGFETNSPLSDCGTANGTLGLYCNGSVVGWGSGGTGSGSAGTIQLSMTGPPTGQSMAAYNQTHLLPAQGNNAAYINNYGQLGSGYVYLEQTLSGVTLQPDTTYTLTYDVARRLDDVGGNFRIQVNAVSGAAVEGTDYWILAGDTTNFTAGQWVSETLTFTTPSDASLFSGTPTVFLVNDGSDGVPVGNSTVSQIEFDTPEPGFYGLLAVGLAVLSVAARRRKSASFAEETHNQARSSRLSVGRAGLSS